MELSAKHCVPCEGGALPLTRQESEPMIAELKDWTLADDARSLSRQYQFKDFARALAFANKIGVVAEEEGHHPDLHVAWGRVGVRLSTHAIGGLSENDFILAAKIDRL